MAVNKEKIKEYINEQIAQADFRMRAYVFDTQNKKRPNRDIFIKIQSHLDRFLAGNKAYRWVTLTGLRGAGKTTIMHQLYFANKNIDGYFLILSVDEITQTLGSSINEVINIFEEIIGKSIVNLDRPLFLFLDEVQYDGKWGVALKTVYDRAHNVFIFSTGSAAVLLNSNSDIARRAIYEKIYPLSFSEFIKIKRGKYETKGLAEELREIIFGGQNAQEVYDDLKKQEQKINEYYFSLSRLDFENYLYYGSLPFMIALENESLVYDQINKSLERVINADIPQLRGFSPDIVRQIPAVLYAVADMDILNFTTLAEKFGISRPKIAEIFSALEQTEILHRIFPQGSHFKQVTQKSSKYLFSSPAFRAMYYKTIGNTITAQNARGKLFEDLIGMYLYRLCDKKPNFSLTYDSAKGGADFIVSVGEKKIVIEVGMNKEEYRQVIQTAEKVKASYGMIISEQAKELEYNQEKNALKIPLKYFLLM
ncbi:AAA family ATPase [Patescibacteria group bacterium]|nr:AAA family ATPase [Patescibacteria group bacterium]MBU4142076.1 AAA family ATPase [Patescibacteria group bacterium]